MGIFDRLLGRGTDTGRRSAREEYYPPEDEPLEVIVDHEFFYPADPDDPRTVTGMGYRVRIENGSDYPMGAPRIEFEKRTKLGRFGEPDDPKGMVDPGKSMEITTPFRPSYAGGKEAFAFRISFFDFRHRSEEQIDMKSEPLKVLVPRFKPLKKDEDGYRLLTSNLYRWVLETDVMELPPKKLFGSLTEQIETLGFEKANELLNENLFRGIRQFCASDEKGRKWAAQVQIIGKGKQSKLLLYTFGERPQQAYNLATRILLKLPEREQVIKAQL
ncbi:MAG: hypothetical protein QCI82_05815 [Candidatus Thermoplasmatota archaeon]|nr:hypothetical protein [Candidatus Thermoplasmatota archaeon]